MINCTQCIFSRLKSEEMSPDERKLLQQSKEATEAAEIDDGDQLRIAGMVNGDYHK